MTNPYEMNSERRAISAAQFALAIQDLPVENIYSKASEIENSISHLERSNKLLQEYSDSIKNEAGLPAETREEGDKDCLDAIKENDIVIERQRQRIDLLRKEVGRRGGRWHEADNNVEPYKDDTNGANGGNGPPVSQRPRLTDEELRRQLEARMAEDNADDEDGMHL